MMAGEGMPLTGHVVASQDIVGLGMAWGDEEADREVGERCERPRDELDERSARDVLHGRFPRMRQAVSEGALSQVIPITYAQQGISQKMRMDKV